MLRTITLTTVVVALATALAGSLSTAGAAAPKPGFVPGTWVGKGVIKGYVVDGPMATHWNGGISFTLKVSKKLRASGSGTWTLDMLGSEDAPSSYGVDATFQGSAALGFTGPATGPAFSGMQHVKGEIRSAGVSRPVSFDRLVKGQLLITKATKCRVTGGSKIQAGVTLSWSAVLKGATCR